MSEQLCPCGSQNPYEECCKKYLEGGALAPDCETLMRSRYTAFVKNDMAYLKKTWHPDTLPDDLTDEPNDWIYLEIISSDSGDTEGEVEFIAKLIYDGKLEVLHEVSSFEKIDGAWLYHSGEFEDDEVQVKKIKKSDPCPCLSGKVFKNCHGKD